jgi:hypothetical protein
MKHDGPLGVAGNQGTVHSGSSLPNGRWYIRLTASWSNGRAWARSRIASNITGAIVMVLRQGWARSFPIAMCAVSGLPTAGWHQSDGGSESSRPPPEPERR